MAKEIKQSNNDLQKGRTATTPPKPISIVKEIKYQGGRVAPPPPKTPKK